MEFSQQEYWSGLPFPFPGNLPKPGIKPGCPALQSEALPSEPPGKHYYVNRNKTGHIIWILIVGIFSRKNSGMNDSTISDCVSVLESATLELSKPTGHPQLKSTILGCGADRAHLRQSQAAIRPPSLFPSAEGWQPRAPVLRSLPYHSP